MTSDRIERELEKKITAKWLGTSIMNHEDYLQFKIRNEDFQNKKINSLSSLMGESGILGKRFLDIGSGEGGFVVALKNLGVDATGVDIKDANIEISRLRAGRYGHGAETFIRTSPGRSLPFKDRSFDVVTMFEVLEHVPEEVSAGLLDEAWRVLKKGGIFYAEVPNMIWPYEGHANMFFIHWLPAPLRKAILMRLKYRNLALTNYLDDIIYRSASGWRKMISRYFDAELNTSGMILEKFREEPYRYGHLKGFKKSIKRASLLLPNAMLLKFYRIAGPVCFFAFRKG